jgi:hypothetical protein
MLKATEEPEQRHRLASLIATLAFLRAWRAEKAAMST